LKWKKEEKSSTTKEEKLKFSRANFMLKVSINNVLALPFRRASRLNDASSLFVLLAGVEAEIRLPERPKEF
jgi:hypothetical protein